jgi:predicted exporter
MSGAGLSGTRARLIVAALLIAGMAAYSALRMKVTTDITHFLPAGSDHRMAQLSRELADSPLTRTLILSIGAAHPDADLRAAAAALAERVGRHPEVASIQRGPTPEMGETVYKLYASRLPYFVSDRPESEIPAALGDAGLDKAAAGLKRSLALPLGPLVSRLAGADPLQWFPAILRRFERTQAGGLEVDGDQFVTRPDPSGRRHAILFLSTKHSAFDSQSQAPLMAEIQSAFDEINHKAGGALTLQRAGVAPIAIDAEHRIKGDLERISGISTVGVVLVFVLMFGSVRSVLLAMLPVAVGALAATTIGLMLFGQLHGMTLAIGSTLIGVADDYPILLLTNRAMAPPSESPESVVRRIWMGILLGGLTTAAGFAALAWTSFPGVREMAVTSTVGILAALAATRYILPPLMGKSVKRTPLLRGGSALAGHTFAWLGGGRRRDPAGATPGTATAAPTGITVAVPLRIGLVAAVVILCAIGLPRLHWLDSLAALNAAAPALKDETDRVRAQVSRMDDGRFVIATAPDEEQALRINDQIALRLEAAEARGVLEASSSLHAFVWSADLQRRNRAAVAASPDLGARVLAALRRQGFKPEAFAAFERAAAALRAPAETPPLRLDDLRAGALAPLVRPFIVKVGDDVGILTFVRGVKHPDLLAAALADLPGARFFDQTTFLDETYARFRVQTLQAMGVGIILICIVLLVRYRNLRMVMAGLLPAVLAAAATLALLGATGVQTNLLHVLALLLVLSMGTDYGIFLVESAPSGTWGTTLMSLVTSSATTVMAFGLLAFSTTPALRAIGLTTGVGILFSLMLAPLALVLTRPTDTAGAPGG